MAKDLTPKNNLSAGDDNEVVTMKRGELRGLLAEMISDGIRNQGAVRKPKRVVEREAFVRFHDGKPVIGYGNVREEKDGTTGKNITWFDITLMGEKSPVKVEYLKFLNSANSVKVKVLSQEVKEIVSVEGTMRTQNPDPANISGKFKDYRSTEIDLEVTKHEYESEVEVVEGDNVGMKFKISNSALNA